MDQHQKFIRQQQEQMRRMQMGAAWMEQQKAKAALQQEEQFLSSDPYTQLEQLVMHMRQEYAAKRITKEQAESKLRQSLIQDEQGAYWTVGFETGEWYRNTGGQWVKATPVREMLRTASSLPEAVPQRKPRTFLGFIAFLFGCALTFGAGFATGSFVYNTLGLYNPYDIVAAFLVWGIGFILSIRWGRKVARGY